jgi:hypothetical protein
MPRPMPVLLPPVAAVAPKAAPSSAVTVAAPCSCLTRLEEHIALLELAVDALLAHTGCPAPLPVRWQPSTIAAWLT